MRRRLVSLSVSVFAAGLVLGGTAPGSASSDAPAVLPFVGSDVAVPTASTSPDWTPYTGPSADDPFVLTGVPFGR